MQLTDTLIKLLEHRGITGETEIAEFLSSKPRRTYDPSLLADAEAGVDFILEQIKKDARICIYGDYDADGITATSLMLNVLSHLTAPERLGYYIPSRFEEGYGLNREAIRSISERGYQAVITVDCGSVSAEEVAYAKELGLAVLVTDHHTITDRMADCLLVNPKRPDSVYPFREICGCGVAFKMAQLLQKKCGLPKHVLTEVLDLAAIGTMGDIMPMLDENRTICKYGMQMINCGSRYGLRMLAEGVGLNPGYITSENISFVIVPHLNATGRMEDAYPAVRLLTATEGDPEVPAIVEDLIFKNKERRRLQQETFLACTADLEPEDFILIRSDHAHEGIAGIVAGKIKETYHRPTVIVTPSGDEKQYLKGTGRSIEGVNLYALLKHHEHLFEKFGGHAGACGFLMPAVNFEALREGLLADMKQLTAQNPHLFEKHYAVDLDLTCDTLTIPFAEELALLEPFGNKNPKPLLRIRNVRISRIRMLGTEGKHVGFSMTDRSGCEIACVLFNQAERYMELLRGGYAGEVLGSLECRTWQGRKQLQFMVEALV
mgnify:FL=1